MKIRALRFGIEDVALAIEPPSGIPAQGWTWIDITAGPDDVDGVLEFAGGLGLDSLAVRDAIVDTDLPKVDDFGRTVHVVLHALSDERIESYEISCFLSGHYLVTIHGPRSRSIEAMWRGVSQRPELATGGPDEALARLADVATRRLVSVLDVFDDRNEELNELALKAAPGFLAEITAVRADLAALRRSVHPQRETLDVLRRTSSPVLTDAGRRRLSDVFDTASRAAQGVEAARTALAESLDAYRGAEARQATEVTRVLTIYAAIMLPLSLVAGFFGMNFIDLPLIDRSDGWIIVTVFMAVVAFVSLGVFVSLGWMRRPSGRTAGGVLGRGLIEAARAPAQLVGAVLEISATPLRTIAGSVVRRHRPRDSERDESPGGLTS